FPQRRNKNSRMRPTAYAAGSKGEGSKPEGAKKTFFHKLLQDELLSPGVQVPPPSIAESQSHPHHHKSHRRNQQHQHRLVQRLLSLLGRGLRVRVAHSAALPECGQGESTKDGHDEQDGNRLENRPHSPQKTVSLSDLCRSS